MLRLEMNWKSTAAFIISRELCSFIFEISVKDTPVSLGTSAMLNANIDENKIKIISPNSKNCMNTGYDRRYLLNINQIKFSVQR